MALKEENYSRLLKKYDQLLKDFTDLTYQGTKQMVNPLGPEDYNFIFSKYKEVKQQEKQEADEAKRLRSPRPSSKKRKKKSQSPKNGSTGKAKRSISATKPKPSTSSKIVKRNRQEDD